LTDTYPRLEAGREEATERSLAAVLRAACPDDLAGIDTRSRGRPLRDPGSEDSVLAVAVGIAGILRSNVSRYPVISTETCAVAREVAAQRNCERREKSWSTSLSTNYSYRQGLLSRKDSVWS